MNLNTSEKATAELGQISNRGHWLAGAEVAPSTGGFPSGSITIDQSTRGFPLKGSKKGNGCGSKIGTLNRTLASGNMDQSLRSPSGLILTHTLNASDTPTQRLRDVDFARLGSAFGTGSAWSGAGTGSACGASLRNRKNRARSVRELRVVGVSVFVPKWVGLSMSGGTWLRWSFWFSI